MPLCTVSFHGVWFVNLTELQITQQVWSSCASMSTYWALPSRTHPHPCWPPAASSRSACRRENVSPKPSPSAHIHKRHPLHTTKPPSLLVLLVWRRTACKALFYYQCYATTQGHLSTITSTPPPQPPHICVVSARATFNLPSTKWPRSKPVGDQVTRKNR